MGYRGISVSTALKTWKLVFSGRFHRAFVDKRPIHHTSPQTTHAKVFAWIVAARVHFVVSSAIETGPVKDFRFQSTSACQVMFKMKHCGKYRLYWMSAPHQRMATGMAQNQGSQWIPGLNGSKMDCAMADLTQWPRWPAPPWMVWCATMVQRLCVQRLNAKIVIGLGVIHNLVYTAGTGRLHLGSVCVISVIVPCGLEGSKKAKG